MADWIDLTWAAAGATVVGAAWVIAFALRMRRRRGRLNLRRSKRERVVANVIAWILVGFFAASAAALIFIRNPDTLAAFVLITPAGAVSINALLGRASMTSVLIAIASLAPVWVTFRITNMTSKLPDGWTGATLGALSAAITVLSILTINENERPSDIGAATDRLQRPRPVAVALIVGLLVGMLSGATMTATH